MCPLEVKVQAGAGGGDEYTSAVGVDGENVVPISFYDAVCVPIVWGKKVFSPVQNFLQSSNACTLAIIDVTTWYLVVFL